MFDWVLFDFTTKTSFNHGSFSRNFVTFGGSGKNIIAKFELCSKIID